MKVIDCESLTKNYKKRNALAHLTFSIHENKIVGLIGRNGAGKTTLLKILAGFYKPSSGKVSVFSVSPFNQLSVSANTIYVDDSMHFPTSFSLAEILEQMKKFYKNWDRELAGRLSSHFNLSMSQNHDSLSKGEKSTFHMIIGLAARCSLTIFDEPTTGMDASVRKDFYRALLKEYIDYPRTILLSTHHLEEIEDVLEEVLLIDQGRKYFHGSMEDLREQVISLTGKEDIIYPWIFNRNILHTRKYGEKEVFVALENRFTANELDKIELSGVTVSSVSATEACIYLTSNEKGSIDDVFNRG